MQRLADIRYPIWLCFAAGFLIGGGLAVLANPDAKSMGEAMGFAVIPALATGGLAAFLGFRHNRKLRR